MMKIDTAIGILEKEREKLVPKLEKLAATADDANEKLIKMADDKFTEICDRILPYKEIKFITFFLKLSCRLHNKFM